MASRLISASVGIPLVVGAVLVGLPWLSLLAAILASVGAVEFYHMAQRREARPAVLLGVAWALSFIVSGHLNGRPTPWIVLGGVALTLSWHQLSRLVRLSPLAKTGFVSRCFNDSMVDWAYTASGAFYTGWTLSLFLILREGTRGVEWVLMSLLGTFATDTGAFLTGRMLGRRALAPRISPSKTWEGAIGGVIFGIVTISALAYWLEMPVSTLECAVLGALVGISAQVGDLVESMIKRASSVKDSGWLIPGHGGVLDRLDSIVFVIPVVYHFSVWIAR